MSVARAGHHGTLGQPSAQVIDGSLKFNSGSSNYLSRTPSSASNRKTWTWSGWVQKTGLGTQSFIFSCLPSGSYFQSYFSADKLYLQANTPTFYVETTQVFRDLGWYHIVIVLDTPQTDPTDRLKLYVNGEEASFGTDQRSSLTQNSDLRINDTQSHSIGSQQPLLGVYANFNLSQVYFIDGQALDASHFGFTDPLTNTWKPKKYTRGVFEELDKFNTYTWGEIQNQLRYQGIKFPSSAGGTVAWKATGSSNTGLNLYTSTDNSTWTRRLTNQTVDSTNGLVYESSDQYVILVNGTNTNWSNQLQLFSDVNGATIHYSNVTYPGNGSPTMSWSGPGYTDGTIASYNSFYLPMDGNSPIGEDKSGKGNNWTPVNFGGSVALPKATGALPILNTDGGGNVARVGVRTDAYYANLVLALPLVGSKDDVSNSVNSGSTTKVVTSTNAVASSAASNFYGGSWYFDGSGDYLTVPYAADTFSFGTGDFTIEAYVNMSAVAYTAIISSTSTSINATNHWLLGFSNTANMMSFKIDGSGNSSVTSNFSGYYSKWTHVAVSRESGTIRLFFDGIEKDSATDNSSLTGDSGNAVKIGQRYTNQDAYSINGYMQDLRVYNGVAKYTSNFVVPATSPDILPDTPSGVSGSSKLAKITDGAVSFDGTDDRLISDIGSGGLGSGDFTIEFFSYANTTAGSRGMFQLSPTSGGLQGAGTALAVYHETGQSSYRMYVNNGASGNSTSNINSNRWNHFALVRSGSTQKLYINGIEEISASSSIDYTTARYLCISGYYSTSYLWDGFISNFRIVKGTALYTANFTAPLAPLTNVTNTEVLCCQSTYEPGSAVVASSVSGVNNGTQWSFYTTTTEGPLGPKDFYSTGNDANHLFDGVNTDLCYGGYGLGGALDSDIIFAPPNGITVSSKLEVYVAYYSKIKVNGSDYNTGGQSTGLAWVTVSNGGGNFTGSLNKLILENTSNANIVRAGAIRIDDSTVLLDPLSPQGDVISTNFNPFTTDINAVRGQETGYPTWNPLTKSTSTLSNGNLTITTNGGSGYPIELVNTFTPAGRGQWYWEFTLSALSGTNYTLIGMLPSDSPYQQGASLHFAESGVRGFYVYVGYNGSVTAYSGAATAGSTTATIGVGGVVGWAYDAENGTLKCFINGVPQGTQFTNIRTDVGWLFGVTDYDNSATASYTINFGQKPFKYAPPASFQPLNAANLRPETVIARPDHYVGATTWSGNDSNPRYISTPNLKADLVWIKTRDAGYHHGLFDSVRGAGGAKRLYSDETFAEGGTGGAVGTAYGELSAFNNGGFTVNTGTTSDIWVNNNGNTYVAWCWKAGGNKNTFNVDDVGYASASDVNMSVGSLNSSVYNQTQTWSNNITTTGNSGNFIAKTAMFDTDFTNYAHCNGDGLAVTVTLTINPPIQVNKSITLFGGLTSYNAGTIQINDGPTFGLSLCATVNPAFTDSTVIPVNGLVNKITVKRTSTAAAGLLLYGWKFDDQRLIDNGLSAPNAPSIAPTGCSVNTKSKFGIYTWNGHGSTNETLPHRLGAKPDFMICKKKSTGGNSWVVWHKSIVTTKYLILNSAAAEDTDATLFNSHLNDGDNLWTLGTNNSISDTGQSAVAYLWCDVPGLQKFGSYVANDNADGPFVELSFRPALIWLKPSSRTGNWTVIDVKRDTFNVTTKRLSLNLSTNETDQVGTTIDILSNGFKCRTSSGDINNGTNTYLYCAWAETPTVNLYGGQSNAR